ncbi:MAG: 4-phosphopantetheinyl transferase family protein, partial [Ruminococcaceae bacterium]|nr:4-phosphopantetheinyl transferase family protein [Oscillospiraceae bacterium]
AERYFNSAEIAYLKESSDPEREFYDIWSKKEAVVKMLGFGINSRFSSFSTVSEYFEFDKEKIVISNVILPITEKYSAFAASGEKKSFKIITL